MPPVVIELEDVDVNYGNVKALRDVSIKVHEGELITLIGANGAGKSSTLLTIMGIVPSVKGNIRLYSEKINNCSSEYRVKSGVALVPEGRRIFPDLTVYENLEMGGFNRSNADLKKDIERCFELFPILRERKGQLGGTLSGGEQQMLAISRALVSSPKIILLDEPSLGLAPLVVEEVFKVLIKLNKEGSTILLVEQNAKKALAIANRSYVLENGRIVLEGTAEEVKNNPQIIDSYLGGGLK